MEDLRRKLDYPGPVPCPYNTWSQTGNQPCIDCTKCESTRKTYPALGEYHREPYEKDADGCGNINPGKCPWGYTPRRERNCWGGGLRCAVIYPTKYIKDVLEGMDALPPQDEVSYKRKEYNFEPSAIWNSIYLTLMGNPVLQFDFVTAVNDVIQRKRAKYDSSSEDEDKDDIRVFCGITAEQLDAALILLGTHTMAIPSVVVKLQYSDPRHQGHSLNTLIYRLNQLVVPQPHASGKRKSREYSPKRILRRKSIRRKSHRKSIRRKSRRKSIRRKSRRKSIRRNSRRKSIRKSRRKSVKKSRH